MSEEIKKHLILSCGLCGDRGLHVIGEDKEEVRQCISCGYVTSDQYKLKKGQVVEDNEEWKKLSDEMKDWSKSDGDRIWIPIMMTLPFAMLYPKNVRVPSGKLQMRWCIAYMTAIPEDDQKNYPVPGYEDQKLFYNKKYDTDGAREYDSFLLAMSELNQISKTISEVKESRENQKEDKDVKKENT